MEDGTHVRDDSPAESRRMAFIALGLFLAFHPIYTLVQILYLMGHEVPWFIRRDLLEESIVVNLILDASVLVFLALNLRPPRWLGSPARLLHWSGAATTLVLLAGWGMHYHWGGTQSSQLLAVILGTFVIVSWFLPPRTIIGLAVVTTIYIGVLVILEVTGVIPYAPLFSLGPELAQAYTAWPVVMVNAVIYLSAFAVVLGGTLRSQRVLFEGRRALEREVAERIRAERLLRGTLERLARTNDELRGFIRGTAHDLRSPLTAIEGYASLLGRDEGLIEGSPGRRRVERVLEGTEHMGRLLDDLSRLVLEDTGEVRVITCDAGRVLERVVGILDAALLEAGARLDVGELPMVLADEGRLAQIFQNLLENALKYRGTAAPEIRVEAHRTDDVWTFGVHDNGVGIDAGALERIFEPFSRLGGEDRPGGHGIGLSVCRQAIQTMGGTIWAEHREGGGTSILFTLSAV
jgi:signal transduction histidine kinase